MAKSLFNGTCGLCRTFKPGCAEVFRKVSGKATLCLGVPFVMCKDCRRKERGQFRLDPKHK